MLSFFDIYLLVSGTLTGRAAPADSKWIHPTDNLNYQIRQTNQRKLERDENFFSTVAAKWKNRKVLREKKQETNFGIVRSDIKVSQIRTRTKFGWIKITHARKNRNKNKFVSSSWEFNFWFHQPIVTYISYIILKQTKWDYAWPYFCVKITLK